MTSSDIQRLYSSLRSLQIESTKMKDYIERNQRQVAFSPWLFDADYKVYCKHYNGVIDFCRNLDKELLDPFIKEKILNLPDLSESDFKFSTFGIPVPILYTILFPVGLIALGMNYSKLSVLKSKFWDIEGNLGTITFMVKAALN